MTLNLTELTKRLQPHSALALVIEPARIVACVVREGEAQELVPLQIPIAAEDLVKNPEKAGKELAAALQGAGIREKRAVVCVPPAWALTASSDLPEISPEDLRDFFELRAESEFSIAVAELRLAHSPYRLPEGQKRATLAAMAAKRLGAVEKMLEVAGRKAVSISLALEQYDRPLLHFIVDERRLTMVVAAGGGVAALRCLSRPERNERNEHAGFGPILRELRITLGRLPDSIRQGTRSVRFSGEANSVAALRTEIQKELEAKGFELAPDQPESNPAIENAKRWLHKQPVGFEFVVAEVNLWSARIERFNTQRSRKIALAAAALILLPLLVFMIQSIRESSLESEWNGMKNAVANINAEQQRIRQFRPWFQPAPHTLQIFEALISAFPETGEVWSKSVQVEGGAKVTCTGFARNEAARMGLLDRLRKNPAVTQLKILQVRGDNPIQFAITFTWEAQDE
jgi:hypothetical protein